MPSQLRLPMRSTLRKRAERTAATPSWIHGGTRAYAILATTRNTASACRNQRPVAGNTNASSSARGSPSCGRESSGTTEK